jgi:hypothetical protein
MSTPSRQMETINNRLEHDAGKTSFVLAMMPGTHAVRRGKPLDNGSLRHQTSFLSTISNTTHSKGTYQSHAKLNSDEPAQQQSKDRRNQQRDTHKGREWRSHKRIGPA